MILGIDSTTKINYNRCHNDFRLLRYFLMKDLKMIF